MVNLPGEGKSDVDLVVRLANINFYQFKATLASLLSTLANLLKQHPTLGSRISGLYTTSWAVRFCVDKRVRVDLLPTFAVPLGFRVQEVLPADRPWYSVCFSKEQKVFVKKYDGDIKRWVRLVKVWVNKFQWPEHCQPKSYLLELMVIWLATKLPRPSGPRELMQRFFEKMVNIETLTMFFEHESTIPTDLKKQ